MFKGLEMKKRNPIVTLTLSLLIVVGTYSQTITAAEENHRSIASRNGGNGNNGGNAGSGGTVVLETITTLEAVIKLVALGTQGMAIKETV
jgi:hypothetical protein